MTSTGPHREEAGPPSEGADPDASLVALQARLKRHPGDRQGHLEAFALCERLYRFDEAIAHARQAHALDPQNPKPLVLAAAMLFLLARHRESLELLQETLPASAGEADAFTLAAEVAERAGELEVGEAYALEALACQPGHARAVRILAHIERRQGNLARARSLLEERLAAGDFPDRWRLLAELGPVLDQLGDSPAAFAALAESKRLLARLSPPQESAARRVFERQREVIAQLQRTDYLRWQDQAASLPSARITLLTGHPRSGTTLLEQKLTSCGSLIGTDESGVFNREFAATLFHHRSGSPAAAIGEWDSWDTDQLDAGRETFLALTEAVLGESVGDRMLLEKDPLRTPDLPLFLRLFPEAKILMPLRHPCDIALSVWMTLLPSGRESWPAASLAAALESVAHTFDCWRTLRDRLPQAWREVRYEKFTHAPDENLASLRQFLDLQPAPARPDPIPSRGISTPSYLEAGGPVHTRSVGRWRRYADQLLPHARRYEDLFREFGYDLDG